jgi:ABC-type nitrate/sulfonate/bicarbonate transport system substrate-binding protein
MVVEEMTRLIGGALEALARAARALEKPTYPYTPPPRPRRFYLAGGYTWKWGGGNYIENNGKDTLWLNASAAEPLLKACGYQPRRVLRLLRRIQAATAWCEARREGRERQAQEILRQQKKALEALEAESVLGKLAQ